MTVPYTVTGPVDFTPDDPDDGGVIDPTILDDDLFNELFATELSATSRTSGTNPYVQVPL